MSFELADRVRETSVTTGTGTLDLDGASNGFQSFIAGIGTGNTTHYAIVNRDVPTEWEVGLATITDATPDILARTTIFSSSNSGSAVDFTAGTKNVFCTRPAEKLTGKLLTLTPEVDQSITAAANTIVSSGSHVGLTPDADYVMTATPTIAAGIDGQIILIHNEHATFTIALQDDSILSDSDVFLGGAEGTIKPGSTMTLHYCDFLPGWSVLSNPNSAIAGANASIIPVRNTSGSSIAGGKTVFITGYNVGQGRITIALADANDAAKMPAMGITSATIGNSSNGDVITDGVAIGLIDTNGQAVGSGVWVDPATPGEVVFTRPAADDIQRIGTVARAHASLGVVHIYGAGRANDIPIILSTTGTISTASHSITSIIPFTLYVETGAAANNKVWQTFVDAEVLNLRVGNDVQDSFTNYQVIQRTANTIDSITWTADVFAFDTGDVGLTNGNIVISTSGKGIDFSAVPDGVTVSSELFDDYKEFTFTPTVTSSGGTFTPTYATQAGFGRKVAGGVFIHGEINVSSVSGTPSGGLRLEALPFTAENAGANTYPDLRLMYLSGVDPYAAVGAACDNVVGNVLANTTTAPLVGDGVGLGRTNVNSAGFTSAFRFTFSGFYQT